MRSFDTARFLWRDKRRPDGFHRRKGVKVHMGDKNVTPAEWNLMECLWENGECTGREMIDELKEKVGWSRSTTLTMLRRMTQKGLVACDESGEIRRYRALINREKAVLQETGDFLERVYKGSVGLLMSTLTKKQELSKEEIDELYAILREAESKK